MLASDLWWSRGCFALVVAWCTIFFGHLLSVIDVTPTTTTKLLSCEDWCAGHTALPPTYDDRNGLRWHDLTPYQQTWWNDSFKGGDVTPLSIKCGWSECNAYGTLFCFGVRERAARALPVFLSTKQRCVGIYPWVWSKRHPDLFLDPYRRWVLLCVCVCVSGTFIPVSTPFALIRARHCF